MDDTQLANLVSVDIGRLYSKGKAYSSDMPMYALTFLRGLGNVFCQSLDSDFKAAHGLEIKIMSLNERGLLKPQIRRYLRTLQKNGNIGAHPESYDFEQHDFAALVNQSLASARGLIEHLYILKHRDVALPDYDIAQVEGSSLKDMCYSAMIEGDLESTHLAGKYFQEKADRMSKGESILRFKDGYGYEAGSFIDQAMFWFKLGSDKKHPDCMYQLGIYKVKLKNSDDDCNEGEILVYTASCYGHADAQAVMGEFHQRGSIRYTPDMELAIEYYRLAADQDHPGALAALGYMYSEGLGCEIDDIAAVQCSLRSAESGYPHAQYNMYCFLIAGQGVETCWDEALKWLIAAANQDFPSAMFALGKHIHDGEIPDRRREESLEYFIRTIDHTEFRVASALGAANVLSGRERPLSDWMLGAHYVQEGYEYILVHGDPGNMKGRLIELAAEIAKTLRDHISMHGPDIRLKGDDLLACCLFDRKGVPIISKETLITEYKELMTMLLRGKPDAAQNTQDFLINRSCIKRKAPRIAEVNIAQQRVSSPGGTKTGRNDRCPCGKGKKFKVCCGR